MFPIARVFIVTALLGRYDKGISSRSIISTLFFSAPFLTAFSIASFLDISIISFLDKSVVEKTFSEYPLICAIEDPIALATSPNFGN